MTSKTYEPVTPHKVAFLGLGVMGAPMARHLLAAGHQVSVYYRTASKAQDWVKQNARSGDQGARAKTAATPREAARDAQIVFCCVGNDTDLRSVEGTYTLGNTAGRVQADGSRTYLAGKASWPVNQQVSVYGKLGVAYNKIDVSTSTPNLSWEDDETEAYGAVGAQYKLNQNVSLIAEYERYGSKKDWGPKADTWSIGARYSF